MTKSDNSSDTTGAASNNRPLQPQPVAAVFLHRVDELSPGHLCWTEEGAEHRYPDGTRFYTRAELRQPTDKIGKLLETARMLASVVPTEFLYQDEVLREWHRILCEDLEALTNTPPTPPDTFTGLIATDELCISVYDAVSRSNITRDVKTPEKKVAVVTGAIAKFGGGK